MMPMSSLIHEYGLNVHSYALKTITWPPNIAHMPSWRSGPGWRFMKQRCDFKKYIQYLMQVHADLPNHQRYQRRPGWLLQEASSSHPTYAQKVLLRVIVVFQVSLIGIMYRITDATCQMYIRRGDQRHAILLFYAHYPI